MIEQPGNTEISVSNINTSGFHLNKSTESTNNDTFFNKTEIQIWWSPNTPQVGNFTGQQTTRETKDKKK